MKKIISISIIAFSLFLGMMIIGHFSGSEWPKNSEALGYKILPENKKGDEKFIESLDNLKNKDLSIKQESPINDLSNKAAESASLSNENITQQIANQISKKVIGGAKDLDSLMQDLKSGNPESVKDVYSLTNEMIAGKLKEINPETLKPKITSNQLNLSTDNSKAAKEKYASDLSYILDAEIKTKKLANFDGKALNDIYLQFDSAIKDLEKLRTPSDLFQFHSDTISILGGIKNSFAEIEKTPSDPAKIIVLVESIETLKAELQDLFKTLDKLTG